MVASYTKIHAYVIVAANKIRGEQKCRESATADCCFNGHSSIQIVFSLRSTSSSLQLSNLLIPAKHLICTLTIFDTAKILSTYFKTLATDFHLVVSSYT